MFQGAFREPRAALAAAVVATVAAAGPAACGGRSGLLPGDLVDNPYKDSTTNPVPLGQDAATPAQCVPAEEVCDGRDNDCDGEVDELPALPCPGGGARYCVGGAWSACPQRCEVCMPGSQRVCILSYCRYWGVQSCAADGRDWGPCVEHEAPAACASIAKSKQYSPELEQCCIDKGYCCLDVFDLDHDGNKAETLGNCDEVACAP